MGRRAPNAISAAVIASLIGHAAVAVGLSVSDRGPLALVAIEPAPPATEVTLVSWEPPASVAAPAARETAIATPRERQDVPRTRATRPAATDAPPPPTDPAPNPLLAMRSNRPSAETPIGAGGANNDRSPGWIASRRVAPPVPAEVPRARAPVLDPLAPLPRHRLRPPRAPASELRHRGGQRYETDEGTYVAHTSPDGTVDFSDKPNVSVRFNLPSKRMLGALYNAWAADPYAHARGESNVEIPSDAIIGGGFDATDAVMRMGGQDPYASKKLAFLDRTRDERARIAAKNERDNLRETARRLRRHLADLAARTDVDWATKRALLFELWDEADGGARHDAARAGAETARATIIGFIRKTIPAGSANAYSATEIAALNRRRDSKARFTPY